MGSEKKGIRSTKRGRRRYYEKVGGAHIERKKQQKQGEASGDELTFGDNEKECRRRRPQKENRSKK